RVKGVEHAERELLLRLGEAFPEVEGPRNQVPRPRRLQRLRERQIGNPPHDRGPYRLGERGHPVLNGTHYLNHGFACFVELLEHIHSEPPVSPASPPSRALLSFSWSASTTVADGRSRLCPAVASLHEIAEVASGVTIEDDLRSPHAPLAREGSKVADSPLG